MLLKASGVTRSDRRVICAIGVPAATSAVTADWINWRRSRTEPGERGRERGSGANGSSPAAQARWSSTSERKLAGRSCQSTRLGAGRRSGKIEPREIIGDAAVEEAVPQGRDIPLE